MGEKEKEDKIMEEPKVDLPLIVTFFISHHDNQAN